MLRGKSALVTGAMQVIGLVIGSRLIERRITDFMAT